MELFLTCFGMFWGYNQLSMSLLYALLSTERSGHWQKKYDIHFLPLSRYFSALDYLINLPIIPTNAVGPTVLSTHKCRKFDTTIKPTTTKSDVIILNSVFRNSFRKQGNATSWNPLINPRKMKLAKPVRRVWGKVRRGRRRVPLVSTGWPSRRALTSWEGPLPDERGPG